jgi:hypothetical protein
VTRTKGEEGIFWWIGKDLPEHMLTALVYSWNCMCSAKVLPLYSTLNNPSEYI